MSKRIQEIIKLTGLSDGPTSIVLAGVHGNEVCGIFAFKEILLTLKISAGTVYFIIGNPKAVAQNKRFVEFNLNRAFKPELQLTKQEKESYEYRRAQFLKAYFRKASALLDIHSSATPESTPFLICEANALSIVRRFPVRIVTSGFDQVNPGGTDEYMNRIGKIGICIECGQHTDREAKEIAKQAIYFFLESQGHIKYTPNIPPISQQRIIIQSIYISKRNFELSKNWSDFENVPKYSIIGTDGGMLVRAQKNSIILFARNCTNANQEAFYLGEKIKDSMSLKEKLGPYSEWPKDGH
jgi:succinylglutamate desuccinylase